MTTNYKDYAMALFEISCEEDCLKESFDDLTSICDALKSNEKYLKVLSSNMLSLAEKYQLVEKAFKGCNYTLLKFIKLLIFKGVISSLLKCSEEFFSLYYKEAGILTGKVISAVPFSDEQKKLLEKKLCDKTKKNSAIIKYAIDPSLIGGAILRFDGEEIDYSIKRKLNDMKIRLSEK